MSILIKGMEMPENGERLCIDIHPGRKVSYNLDLKCKQIATAVYVPPHGRLIDADALNDMINRSYPMTDRVDVHNGYAIVQEMMKQLPTIIEAEGE